MITTRSTRAETPSAPSPLDDLLMLIGADTTGRLLEVGIANAEGIEFIVHAMPARAKFTR